MALSRTSRDIDILTVATLYNRGLLVSSAQTYVPIVSSIGAYSKWTNQQVNSIFEPLLGSYSSGVQFSEAISSIQAANNQISSSLLINNSNALYFISTSYSTLNAFSNMGISTFNNLESIYNLNSTTTVLAYSTISGNYSTIYPGVFSTAVKFYSTLFTQNASSIIQSSIYLYIPRERIEEFTYSVLNTDPLLSGNFGSNNPLQWYWKGVPSQYIGPGMSSISTNFNNIDGIFYNNITTNFPTSLNNISINQYYLNSSLYTYRSSIYTTISNAPNYVDGGSSISTLYEDINSTFVSTLNYASTVNVEVSTLSSFIVSFINDTSPPTLGSFSISQFISTASTIFNNNQNGLSIRLINAMSTRVLALPLSTFSTIVVSSLTSSLKYIQTVDVVPGINILSTVIQSTLNPFYIPLNISTNFLGYQYLSSTALTVFSSFSTNIGFIFGIQTVNNLNNINSGISSLSTSIIVNNSSINSLIYPYITGPGVSSIFADLSTNTEVIYLDYSRTLSSIIIPFTNYLRVVNSAPGVSSIISTASRYNSTIISTISSTYTYVNITYDIERLAIISTNTDIIRQININITNFISAGINAYTSSAIRFNSLSSVTNHYSTYIDIQSDAGTAQIGPGELYSYIASFSSLQSLFLKDLDPFYGSTVYYSMLRTIPDYSTSVYAKGDTFITGPSWLQRSTFFHTISTNTLTTLSSDYIISSLTVNNNTLTNEFNLNIKGSVSIQPGLYSKPDIYLPNFQIYNSIYPIPTDSIQSLLTHNSTMSFNNGDLTVKRVYNRIAFGYVGINSIDPDYSLDIDIGDARKPTGTAWVTVSDRRIKEQISSPSIKVLGEQISSLRLVSYNWTESYRSTLRLGTNTVLGFISQEVQDIFPGSVYEKDEYGFSNFKSLDTDQLYKAKFGVTQDLLNRVSSLQMRVINLMKES